MTSHVHVQGLYKQFGSKLVVDNISFQLQKGEVLGFLGPNGAGKSTTMRMITGYLEPSDGAVSVCGHDVHNDAIAAKRNLGYLPEGSPLYSDMSARQLLEFVAAARGIRPRQRKERLEWVIETLQLQSVVNQSLDTLSKGFKRRVGLAQALIHDPEVLVLDEPTDGLDPIQKQEVRTLITSMAKDKAIIISTHILEEVEPLCTRAMIITQGNMIFDGRPEELLAKSEQHNVIELRLATDDAQQTATLLRTAEGISSVAYRDGLFEIRAKGDNPESTVAEICYSNNWKLHHLHAREGKLDEVFSKLATQQEERIQ